MSDNIKEFLVNKEGGQISWRIQDGEFHIFCADIDQVCLFESLKLILLLSGKKKVPNHLLGYDTRGHKLFRSEAPEGYSFMYIVEYSELEATVVCGGERKVDGWYDWHFRVDPKSGKLTRIGPAY